MVITEKALEFKCFYQCYLCNNEEITRYLGVDTVCLWKGAMIGLSWRLQHCLMLWHECKMSPIVFEHLIPSWFCSRKLWNPSEVGPFWRKYTTRGGFWWFIASPHFLFSFCFLCAVEMWSVSFLLLMPSCLLPCLPHHDGLYCPQTISQNMLFLSEVAFGCIFITTTKKVTNMPGHSKSSTMLTADVFFIIVVITSLLPSLPSVSGSGFSSCKTHLHLVLSHSMSIGQSFLEWEHLGKENN